MNIPEYPKEIRDKIKVIINLDKNIVRDRTLLSAIYRNPVPPNEQYTDNVRHSIERNIEKLKNLIK